MFRALVFIFLSISLSVLCGCESKSTGLIWKIEKNGKTGYLLATYHGGVERYVSLTTLAKKIASGVEAISFESTSSIAYADPHFDQQETEALSQEYEKLINGRVLTNYEVNSLKIVPTNDLLKFLEPLFINKYASNEDLNSIKFSAGPEASLEKMFSTKKKILSLENPWTEWSIWRDKCPGIDTRISLISSLQKEAQTGNMLQQFVELQRLVWLGDFKKFEELFIQRRNTNQHVNLLFLCSIEPRNIEWLPRIDKLLHEQSTLFVVGVGHVVGPNGLLVMLEKSGFLISQIKNY